MLLLDKELNIVTEAIVYEASYDLSYSSVYDHLRLSNGNFVVQFWDPVSNLDHLEYIDSEFDFINDFYLVPSKDFIIVDIYSWEFPDHNSILVWFWEMGMTANSLEFKDNFMILDESHIATLENSSEGVSAKKAWISSDEYATLVCIFDYNWIHVWANNSDAKLYFESYGNSNLN